MLHLMNLSERICYIYVSNKMWAMELKQDVQQLLSRNVRLNK